MGNPTPSILPGNCSRSDEAKKTTNIFYRCLHASHTEFRTGFVSSDERLTVEIFGFKTISKDPSWHVSSKETNANISMDHRIKGTTVNEAPPS